LKTPKLPFTGRAKQWFFLQLRIKNDRYDVFRALGRCPPSKTNKFLFPHLLLPTETQLF
jgi:hypothetical protein